MFKKAIVTLALIGAMATNAQAFNWKRGLQRGAESFSDSIAVQQQHQRNLEIVRETQKQAVERRARELQQYSRPKVVVLRDGEILKYINNAPFGCKGEYCRPLN